MVTLEEVHPGLYVEFMEGKFVAQKTKRSFSAIGFDHAHEQLNDWLKNESGTIGNLDDPQTVLREQVTRPEMARCLRFNGANHPKIRRMILTIMKCS